MSVLSKRTSRILTWCAVQSCTLLISLTLAGCGGSDGPAAVEPDAAITLGPDASTADASSPVTPDATTGPDAAPVPSIDPTHVNVGADFEITAIARDSTGALIIASKRHTERGGGPQGPDDMIESVRLTRYDASGTAVFRHIYGGNPSGGFIDEVHISAVLVDSAGDITIMGLLRGGIIPFGAQRLGAADCYALRPFIARLSPDGTHRWARMPDMPCKSLQGGGLALTSGGDVLVALSALNNTNPTLVNFGGGALSTGSGVLARLDHNGAHRTSRTLFTLAPQSSVTIHGLAPAPSGEIFVHGSFHGELSAGGTTITASSSNQTGFLAKLDSNGTPIWLRGLGGTGQTSVSPDELTATAAGGLVSVGVFAGTVDFGQGPTSTPQFERRAWIARYDAAGALQRVSFVDQPKVSTRVRVLEDGSRTLVALEIDGPITVGGHSIPGTAHSIAFESAPDGSVPTTPLILDFAPGPGGSARWALLPHGAPLAIE